MLYQGIIGGGSSPVEPVDLSPVLLWTNPSPTSGFASQKVSLNLTDYTGVIIEYNLSGEIASTISRVYVKKSDNLNPSSGFYFGGGCGASRGISRGISVVDNEGITFLNGVDGITQDSSASIIPVKIYGVKEYVVEPVVGDLLWTNSNPNAELAQTEITGNYSKYKSILVKAKLKTDNDFTREFNIYKENSPTYGTGMFFVNLGVESYYRCVLLEDSKISINVGWTASSSGEKISNNVAIPLEIYGIE